MIAGRPSFTCPECERTSYHPVDAEEGYCGACRDWTGVPVPAWAKTELFIRQHESAPTLHIEV